MDIGFFPPKSTSCPFSTLLVDMKELYLLMGYGNQEPDSDIQNMIMEILEELKEISTPEYGYTILHGGRKDKSHLRAGETIFSTGYIITSALREADYFAVFAATIGEGFDKYIHFLQEKDDMVKAFIANSLGSVLVEACISIMMKELEKKMNPEGIQISYNYSPGYCDWALTEQEKIFAFFHPGFCGIKLTSSFLMLPIKSVSGIIGIGENVRKRAYSCEICSMATCIKNKKKTD